MFEPQTDPVNNEQPKTQFVTLGVLTIDVSAGIVWRAQRPIQLTSLEIKLLLYLARHIGRVVSVGELLREIWGCCPQTGGSSAQVKHSIYRLHKKIEINPHCPCYVLTAYGHGYYMPTYSAEDQVTVSQF